MKYWLGFIFALLVNFQVGATAQIPDKILYEGTEYKLYSNPLNDFFKKNPEKFHIISNRSTIVSSALWRGYVATFEIKNNQLWVKDIKVQTGLKEWESVIDEVFPNEESRRMEEYSNLLILPYGKMLNYVHMGYASTYERYILLKIESGKLIDNKRFTAKEYEEFKEKQFLKYKKTKAYKKYYKTLKKEKWEDKMIEDFIKKYEQEYFAL